MTEAQAIQDTTEQPRRMTLSEITDRIMAILEQSDEGELTDEQAALFDIAGADMALKVDGYKHAVLRLEAEADARRSVCKPYLAEAQALENRAKRIKEHLMAHMTLLNVREVRGNTGKACIQKNGGKPVVEFDANAPVPDEIAKVERKVDTEKLRTLLEQGAELPLIETTGGGKVPFWARLRVGEHLRFR